MTPSWYLGYAKGGKEFEVAEALTWDGFEVWCGRVKHERIASKSKRFGSRVETVEVPVIPNYIFMNLTFEEFYEVRHKHLHKTMAPLSKLAVREFQAFAEQVERMEVIRDLKEGARVEVPDGVLSGQAATLRRIIEGADQLEVEFDQEMFGRKIRGFVPIDAVRVAE